MNKHELKAKIMASRESLDSAISKIGDERMSLIILHGDWSVKDLIGHLCFWEERVATLYLTLTAGKNPVPAKDLDSLNEQATLEMRKLSLNKVRTRELAAYNHILAILDEAIDSELFDSDHFRWTGGRSFQEIIADNTYGHYDEHMPELIAWLKRIA